MESVFQFISFPLLLRRCRWVFTSFIHESWMIQIYVFVFQFGALEC